MRWIFLLLVACPFSLLAATIPPTEANLRSELGRESFIFFSSSAGRFGETWDFLVSNDLRAWRGAGSHEFETEEPFALDANAFGEPVFFKAVRR